MKPPDLFLDDIKTMFAEADRLMHLPIEMGLKELKAKEPSCNHCTEPACCHQTVYVCLYEVLPMAVHLVESGKDTQDLRGQLRDAGFRMETWSNANWLDNYTPCVLLDKDGRCSVYEHRPIRCRTYWTFSPPEQCAPPSGQEVRFANYTAATGASLVFARQVHKAMRLKETKMRVLMGTLPRVLHIALEAMDPDVNFENYIRAAAWPNANNLGDWINGAIPEPELVKLRLWRDGPAAR